MFALKKVMTCRIFSGSAGVVAAFGLLEAAGDVLLVTLTTLCVLTLGFGLSFACTRYPAATPMASPRMSVSASQSFLLRNMI